MQYVTDAIRREKEIKGWLRKKKEQLIESENPEWRFLNEEVMACPPKNDAVKNIACVSERSEESACAQALPGRPK